MNRDTAAGKFEQLKGKAKQSVGEALGNQRLANSGAADQVKGAVKDSLGQSKGRRPRNRRRSPRMLRHKAY